MFASTINRPKSQHVPLPDLWNHMSQSIVALVTGVTQTTSSIRIWSTYDSASLSFIRNTGSFFTGDTTCIPAMQNSGDARYNQGNGVAVAPDIIITAQHNTMNYPWYFTDNNNVIYSASYVTSSYIGDCCVNKITPPLPATITPAKFLSASYFISGSSAKFLPSAANNINGYAFGMYALSDKFLHIYMIGLVPSSAGTTVSPDGTLLTPWYKIPTSGDSGSPLGVVISGTFVAMGTWATPSGGPSLTYFEKEINAFIQNMGSTSSLQAINLDGFENYSR